MNRRFILGPDRGPGRTQLPSKVTLMLPGKLHLAAGRLQEPETRQRYSIPELFNPPDTQAQDLAILAEAEAAAMAEIEAARAAIEEEEASAPKGKKVSPKETAERAAAEAARMKEVTAKADALRAAASAELKALQASRIIWRHHLEVRALPHEWTPLMYAVRHGGALEVAQLIEAGANVHATDKYGCTPLHKAAHIGGADGVAKAKLLLKAGAYLEARDRWGQTPLHAATVNEQPATIRYLCRAGASQKAQDGPVPNFGNTPLQVAQLSGLDKSLEMLLPWRLRRSVLAAGDSEAVPANDRFWTPPPFSPKRMNVNGKWGPAEVADH